MAEVKPAGPPPMTRQSRAGPLTGRHAFPHLSPCPRKGLLFCGKRAGTEIVLRRPMFGAAFATLPGSKPLDQAGVDEQPVEAARFGAAGAGVEQAFTAFEDAFLLGE